MSRRRATYGWGLIGSHSRRRLSRSIWPSSPARTWAVESPLHTTSAKYGEMWLRAATRMRGSCAAVSMARQEPRLVPRIPIRS